MITPNQTLHMDLKWHFDYLIWFIFSLVLSATPIVQAAIVKEDVIDDCLNVRSLFFEPPELPRRPEF